VTEVSCDSNTLNVSEESLIAGLDKRRRGIHLKLQKKLNAEIE
jgi:hypothetical protein